MMRMLLSYWYYGDVNLDEALSGFQVPLDLFADSGAYSANSQGKPIRVDDYCDWIEREGWRFSTYVNLDVIGDPEGTWRNQQRMEERGLTPIPVFHGGEPWEYLERYCDSHPYVALGGMVRNDPQATMRWCVRCFQIGRRNGVVFHGFGQTQMIVLRSLPWYSVDSSSWASGHRFGGLMLWSDRLVKFVKIPLHDHDLAYANANLIRAHGGDPAEVAHPRSGKVDRAADDAPYWRDVRARIVTMNAKAWLRFEDWLHRHHGDVAPPEGYETKLYIGHLTEERLSELVGDTDTGPKVYMAAVRGDDATTPNGVMQALKDNMGPKVFLVLQAEDRTGNGITGALKEGLGPKVFLALATGPKIYLASSGGDDGKLSDISGNIHSKEQEHG